VCHYGTDINRSEEYAKRADAEEVTPSKKRKRSAPASAKQCTFKIEALFIDNDEASKKLERWSRPVKIKIATLNLCHTCGCSALQQTYVRKSSGFYAKNISEDLKGEELKDLMARLHNNEIITRCPAHLVSEDRPVLKSFPSTDRWLVLKGHFFFNPDRLRHDIQNQVALVTMLDKNGNILTNMENQLVQHDAVYNWMSVKAASALTSAKNVAKFSKVFLAIPDFIQVAPVVTEP
jgi:hypothetical protein